MKAKCSKCQHCMKTPGAEICAIYQIHTCDGMTECDKFEPI